MKCQSNVHTTSHAFSRSTKNCTFNTKIDSIAFKEYVDLVKNAPSIHEEKVALLKEKIGKGNYLSENLLGRMAEKLTGHETN